MISAGIWDSTGLRNSEGLDERPRELLGNNQELAELISIRLDFLRSLVSGLGYLNFVGCSLVRFLIVMLEF